jgi:hypothetical protein
MPSPFDTATEKIDEAHALDPNKITIDGIELPYELHYAQKMTAYLYKRLPNASDALRLAVRAQHFRRWETPRDSYPMTRTGYLTWRAKLKTLQAQQVKAIVEASGYNSTESERVAALMRKENLQDDEETQALEDVACLVFLDDQFEEFEKNHYEDKIINILRKTWGKMSEKGREMALEMKLEGRPAELMKIALAP